jgi:hypothetical protein
VRQRKTATGIRVTETEKRTGIVIANESGNENEKGTGIETETESGTGTKIMTVTVIATATVTVTGTENETATVRGSEIVALGTIVGMTTTPDDPRVIMVVTVNGIGKVTPRETVVTETVIGMRHERQVRERRTRNDVRERMGRKIEAATMNHERSAKQRMMSEVRKCAGFKFLHLSPKISLTLTHRGRNMKRRHLHPRAARAGRKHQRRGRYDGLTFPCNYRFLNPEFSLFGKLIERFYYVHNIKVSNATMRVIPRPEDGG